MNAQWQEFLARQGGVFSHGVVRHFGDEARALQAAAGGNVLCDLGHVGVIHANGEDLRDFLQGQISADTRLVGPQYSCIAAWCNPKGRVLTMMRIVCTAHGWLLLVPAPLLGDTLKRLGMYVLRARVTLRDASAEIVCAGFAGMNAAAHLRSTFGALPQHAGDSVRSGTLVAIRIGGEHPRFIVTGAAPDVQGLWEQCSADATPVGAGPWEWMDICAGIPCIGEATREQFIPQMLNLQALGAVSFDKGCYTGQEIVARTQYLGRLKRRMYLAHVDAVEAPVPGDALYAGGDASTQAAGSVVNAQAAPAGGPDLLAVIRIEAVKDGPVHLRHVFGETLTLRALPYPVAAGDDTTDVRSS